MLGVYEEIKESQILGAQVSDFHDKMMKIALEIAQEGYDNLEVPVGCIFVKVSENDSEYKILAKAHNLTNESNNATLHCEILCIDKINRMNPNPLINPFENLVVYVTCEPCIMCAYALNLVGIKEVYFGCKNEKFGGNGSVFNFHAHLPHPYKTYGGILEAEGSEILRKFYERGNINIPFEKRNRKRQKK